MGPKTFHPFWKPITLHHLHILQRLGLSEALDFSLNEGMAQYVSGVNTYHTFVFPGPDASIFSTEDDEDEEEADEGAAAENGQAAVGGGGDGDSGDDLSGYGQVAGKSHVVI